MKKIKAIYVEYDDARIFNITDLEQPEYEEFMDLMQKLTVVYQTVKNNEESKAK